MAHSLNQPKQQRPDKVGLRLDDSKYIISLSTRIKELLRYEREGFPGSQPVHFETKHFELLENEDYFVRDKTGGKRYIMFFTAVDGGTAFMMDESCQFRTLSGFRLPLRTDHSRMHNETLIDGELVVDEDNNRRYLIFDLMVLNGTNITERPYSKRMGMLMQDVLGPFNTKLEKNVGMKIPFTMEKISMELSYGLEKLKHGNEGLIFIPVIHPYEPGTCKELLLWKPITKLTVDFMIRVPYFKEEKKSIYQLFVYDGVDHKLYDYLALEPDTAIQNSYDGKIATFWYDKHWKTIREGMTSQPHDGGWRFIRFVHGKNKADHEKDVKRIWKCIQNSVPLDMLGNRQSIIRDNWKRRQSVQFPGAQPLPSPTSQIQPPSINNVFGAVPPSKMFFSNNNGNKNTQLVSPSISSSEPFAILKERRPSEEKAQDQNIKNELTESMEALTRSKFSQMLVTSPGKKSPIEAFSYNSTDGNHENFKQKTSYFPPVYEGKSPDQTGQSRPNMKPKDFQNSPSQTFELLTQEKKSPDQRASTRLSIDTCSPLDNSMVSPKNRLEKRSTDIQHSSCNKGDNLMKDLMEASEEIIQSEPSLKTSPTLDRYRSLPKSDSSLKDSELIRNDIMNHVSNANNEPDYESNDDDEMVEQESSDDDLGQKHHRMSISSNIATIVDHESNGNLNKQNNNYRRAKQESNLEEKEYSTENAHLWNQSEQEDYCVEEKEDEKKEDNCGESRDYIEKNNPSTQIKRNVTSPKQSKLPTFEQSQLHQNISSQELLTSVPVQDAQIFKPQQESPWRKHNSLEDIQPTRQIKPKPLEQDNRLISELSQNRTPDSRNVFLNPQNNNEATYHKRIPESQEIPLHSNASQKTYVDPFKNRSEHLQSQNNMLAPMRSQALRIQESKGDIQRTSTQKSPILRDQIQENNIPTSTSSLQQYRVPDNQTDSIQTRVTNKKSQPISVHSQFLLQSTNQVSPTRDIQLIHPTSSTRKATLQNNLSTSESQQDSILTQLKLSESRQEVSQRSCQESRSTIIPQQLRRQTISDSRSIATSQPRQIHVPVQIRAPLQENRLMNPPQIQTQLMDNRPIFQSQVTTQETRPQIQQSLLEYQQTNNGQNTDKQRDLNMEQERFNHNISNFQQALKPIPRRHTLSGANNHLYQQNFSGPYHQRQFSMVVSSYPPPRQEILSSSMPFTPHPISPLQPLHSPVLATSQGSNTLSQIPEEYVNLTHNLSQELFAQPTQQNVKNVIVNSSIPPMSRPIPQKRKSKGALDFILNAGGSNLKRSKYDDEDNDAN